MHKEELEITDLCNLYLAEKNIDINILPRGFNWFDAGVPERNLEAATFVKMTEHNHSTMISNIEEICFNKNYLSKEQLLKICEENKNSSYYLYTKRLVQ